MNLCRHEVVVLRSDVPDVVEELDEDHLLARLPSSGDARLAEEMVVAGRIEVGGESVPIERRVTGPVTGLPDPQPGVQYVVPTQLLGRVARSDLLAPGRVVRDHRGQPVGCRSFVHATDDNVGTGGDD